MFYPIHVLCRKRGRLAIAWIAGTVGFNQSTTILLNKRDLLAVNIQMACNEVISPNEPMALRLAAILMLGITRIYKKQTKFLLLDIEDMYKDMKKYRIVSIDLVDSNNNRGANLVLTDYVGHTETFETDRLLMGLLANLNLISDTSYTEYNTPAMDSFGSILRGTSSNETFAHTESLANIAPMHSITMDNNSISFEHQRNDDLGGPFDTSAVNNYSLDAGGDESLTNPNAGISPIHMNLPEVDSHKILVRNALDQCGLPPIEEEQERPPKRRKKSGKLVIDRVTRLTSDQIKHNLATEVDTKKERKLMFPPKGLECRATLSFRELLSHGHMRSLRNASNHAWDEMEAMKTFSAQKSTDETVSSTNFSRMIETSASQLGESIMRNISNVSVNALQPDDTITDITPMHLAQDESLPADPNIPYHTTLPCDTALDDEMSFHLREDFDSCEVRNMSSSSEADRILERFYQVQQSSKRPFIFMRDLFSGKRPHRKEVSSVFYGVLKHASALHPEQTEAYGQILLRCA